MKAFLVEDDGNPEAGVLNEESLDGVSEFRRSPGVLTSSGVAWTSDLPDSATVPEGSLSLVRVEVAFAVHKGPGLGLPDAHHLRGLFFESHTGQKVCYPYVGGKGGISIDYGGLVALFALEGNRVGLHEFRCSG